MNCSSETGAAFPADGYYTTGYHISTGFGQGVGMGMPFVGHIQTNSNIHGASSGEYQHAPNNSRRYKSNARVGSKLFVGQVPAMATEKQLYAVFEPYGELLEVKIMRDSLGRSKGSAWVRYEVDEMALSAINALHEKHTIPPQTNPLRVQFATPHYAKHRNQQIQSNPTALLVNPNGFVSQMNLQGTTMMLHPSPSFGMFSPYPSDVRHQNMRSSFDNTPKPPLTMTNTYMSPAKNSNMMNPALSRTVEHMPVDSVDAVSSQRCRGQSCIYSSTIPSPIVDNPRTESYAEEQFDKLNAMGHNHSAGRWSVDIKHQTGHVVSDENVTVGNGVFS
ncbi:putative RNA-binding protein [Trypanosoma vivax]|nr:putative RNA-binding protein [Trypanosoma vivax]